MISGIAAHRGGPDLARHLLDADANASVAVSMHGLVSDTLHDALEEMRLMASGAKTKKPLLHAFCSPSRTYSDVEFADYWENFEREFGLTGQPYAQALHEKPGKGGRTAAHMHRVYLRVRIDRSVIPLHASYLRQEKVARIAEFRANEALTQGHFNRAVAAALVREGRADVAEAMREAGLLEGPIRMAPTSAERGASERRKGMAADEIWRRAIEAWRSSDDGLSLLAALDNAGLRLGRGDKTILVLAADGQSSFLHALQGGASIAGQAAPLKRDMEERLKGVPLPLVSEIPRQEPQPTPPDLQITGRTRRLFAAAKLPGDASDQSISLSARPALARPVQPQPMTFDQPERASALPHASTGHVFGEAGADRAIADPARVEVRATSIPTFPKVPRTAIVLPPGNRAGSTEPDVSRTGSHQLGERAGGHIAWAAIPGEWDRLRAYLAKFGVNSGGLLRWVGQEDGRTPIRLGSGTRLVATSRRVTASEPSLDTVDAIVEHAVQEGWRAIEILGGSPEWREALIMAADLSGLPAAIVTGSGRIPVQRSSPRPSEADPSPRFPTPAKRPVSPPADDDLGDAPSP